MQITLFTNGKTNTKSVMKASISLVVAAMLLTAVLAVPAAAQKQVPFKGSLQGHETDTPEGGPPPTTLNVDGNTTGIASHVGQFSFSYQLTVTLADGTATGSAHLIAANGDSIYTTVAGSSEMTATDLEMSEVTPEGGTDYSRCAGSRCRRDRQRATLHRQVRYESNLGEVFTVSLRWLSESVIPGRLETGSVNIRHSRG